VLTNPLAAFSPDVLADMLLLDTAHVTPRCACFPVVAVALGREAGA
jgi:hypothetical protein